MRTAAFLDRDGTLIEDRDYLSDPAGIQFLPGAAEALGLLNRLGIAVVLTSNQSGVGRTLITEDQHVAVHTELMRRLGEQGCFIDAAYYCTHAPEVLCECRKPKAGMLLSAASDLGLSLADSFMVGDRMTDVQAGQLAGCRTALVLTGHGRDQYDATDFSESPDFVGDNLGTVASWIRSMLRITRSRTPAKPV